VAPDRQEYARRWRLTAADPRVVLLDGFHAVKHALRFGADVRLVLTTDRAGLRALSRDMAPDIAAPLDTSAVELPAALVRTLVPKADPTGVVALATRPDDSALAALPRRSPVVVLDHPRNLGNVGAVVRLAAGLGATGVITTGDLDPWHPNALRGSAGLHFAVAVARRERDDLPAGPLIAFDPDGDDIRSIGVPDDALLAFGSERHGLSPDLRAKADRLVAVPMTAGVSSFNLATTVAMGLFHWLSGRAGGC
jgi:tRNA G18 (ribose-2'-O)-methylase SpoU